MVRAMSGSGKATTRYLYLSFVVPGQLQRLKPLFIAMHCHAHLCISFVVATVKRPSRQPSNKKHLAGC